MDVSVWIRLYDELALSTEKQYVLSFDAYADEEKEIETNTIPQLNGWIALIILAIIFAPIFANLAKGLESHTVWHYIVLLMPIFMVLIGYIIVLISEFNKGSQWKSFSTALNRMLLVYKGKEVHENKYETISSEEPTVEAVRNVNSAL